MLPATLLSFSQAGLLSEVKKKMWLDINISEICGQMSGSMGGAKPCAGAFRANGKRGRFTVQEGTQIMGGD